jgi:RNA polymerase subunit RPABC4/transcription elongation factor Spt4
VDFSVRFGTQVTSSQDWKGITFDVNPSGSEIAKPTQEQIATLAVSSNHG